MLKTTAEEEVYDMIDNSIIKYKICRTKTLDKFCDLISTFPYKEILEFNRLSLKMNQEIIADKGSNIIIRYVEKYKNAILSLLQNPSYIEKITKYQQSKIKAKLKSHIHKS